MLLRIIKQDMGQGRFFVGGEKMEKRTLCKRCAENYRTAGYLVKDMDFQYVREPCDICSHPGIEYEIAKRRGGERCEHS